MKFFYLILCILLTVHSNAQKNAFQKCKIIDSSTSELIMDGKFLITTSLDTITNAIISGGEFSVECAEYLQQLTLLTIISQGYDTLIMGIDTAFCVDQKTHLIKLNPSVKTLQTVDVVARAILIKQDIDKITYNVAADADSKTLNLLEIMPKLPFVSLSPEDNPIFKGKSNFIVLMNGKRSSLFSGNNLRDALKAIPASTISKIEVITDPPPKYENEGYIGVINIVTFTRPGNGYNASTNLSAGTFISGVNGSLNFRRNNFGATFLSGINFERTPYNSSYSETSNSIFTLTQQGENKINNDSKNVSALFSYEIDSLNLVTLDIGASDYVFRKLVNESVVATNINSTELSTYLFNFSQREVGIDLNSNINYERRFKNDKERLLTLSYLYNNSSSDEKNSNTLQQRQNFNGNNYLQLSKNGQSDNAFQLDYVHPVRNMKIETGAKYIYRNIFNDFSTTVTQPNTNISFLDTLNTDNLNYTLSIMGLYNSYRWNFKSFSFRGGFRFENTALNGIFESGNNEIKQNYYNFLPSLKLLYSTTNSGTYGLSFKQQIERPGYGLLNPLILRSAPGFSVSGNPKLDPVLFNYINFEFSKFGDASISLILNYTFSKNTIQSVSSTLGDTMVLTTFENIGQYNRLGIENSTEIPITSKLNFSVDGSLYYVTVESKQEANYLSNRGIEGFIYSYLTYRIKRYRLIANLGFYGPTVNVQAISNSYFYSSLGGSVRILKNKGNLSLRVANPFQKYRLLNSNIDTPDLVQYVERKNLFRGIQVSFSYRFGKLDEEVKRNKRSLEVSDGASETGKIK